MTRTSRVFARRDVETRTDAGARYIGRPIFRPDRRSLRRSMQTLSKPTFEALSRNFHHWQKVGDMIDQCIDLMLNLRQSGHPGGSRSKVPLLVASTLGAGMRWDPRHPEKAFGDRFVLVAGHCNPVIYAMLAVYNEALRARFEETGDQRYAFPKA